VGWAIDKIINNSNKSDKNYSFYDYGPIDYVEVFLKMQEIQ
jgi:hypothetical protein